MHITAQHDGLCDAMTEQALTIADLDRELAAYKRANDRVRCLLADAQHAVQHHRLAVADELVDRALSALPR